MIFKHKVRKKLSYNGKRLGFRRAKKAEIEYKHKI